MNGVNYATSKQLTNEELDSLVGAELEEIVYFKNEYHVVTSLSPLKLSPHWDLDTPYIKFGFFGAKNANA